MRWLFLALLFLYAVIAFGSHSPYEAAIRSLVIGLALACTYACIRMASSAITRFWKAVRLKF